MTLAMLATLLLPGHAAAHQGERLEKADEMMRCMVYLLKYKYDDFYSSEEKAEEAQAYEGAAKRLSSDEYFESRIFEIDHQLMVSNMAAMDSRSGRQTVEYYDEQVRQCRLMHAEYQAGS